MRRKLHTLLFLGAACALFLFPQGVAAETSIYLDAAAMERGYTVHSDDGNMLLGIFPGVFQEPARVKIVRDTVHGGSVPDGMTRDGEQYLYDVAIPNPHALEKPVVVALRNTGLHTAGVIAFYVRETNEWRPVPSWQGSDGFLRAFLPFPYSRVTILHADEVALSFTGDDRPYLILDDVTGKVLGGNKIDQVASIASLTKLVTASVVLDTNPHWQQVVVIESDDDRPGAKVRIAAGDSVTVRDLFYSMLVGSANNAAVALARSTGLSPTEFVQRMNDKAAQLGLSNTKFFEPSGLDARNVSTAREYALLARSILRNFQVLQGTTAPSYAFRTLTYGKDHAIKNTNALLASDLYITGGKTGYLDEAGYCLLLKSRKAGSLENIIVVVLGHATSQQRFDAAAILSRAFQ